MVALKPFLVATAAAIASCSPSKPNQHVIDLYSSALSNNDATAVSLVPGLLDFELVEGSQVQAQCEIQNSPHHPGSLCIEFAGARAEEIVDEYRRRLRQSGWIADQLPPDLVGANVTTGFKRSIPNSSCYYSLLPMVYDKVTMPLDLPMKGEKAVRDFRREPGRISVLAIHVERLDPNARDLICATAGSPK
ncbi:MAG: hypothetical protein IV086_13040 [Hyphomonadaceae bacterium]|nr:MAG: hypothetical protein FD160_2405 [Caulobacteraceae bacterium]MBT9446621.1 hypothetical protein [Hyphomonadaceae bacterium]